MDISNSDGLKVVILPRDSSISVRPDFFAYSHLVCVEVLSCAYGIASMSVGMEHTPKFSFGVMITYSTLTHTPCTAIQGINLQTGYNLNSKLYTSHHAHLPNVAKLCLNNAVLRNAQSNDVQMTVRSDAMLGTSTGDSTC